VQVKLPQTDDINRTIDEAGLDTLEYGRGAYKFRLTQGEITAKSTVLLELMRIAYQRRSGD